MNKKQQLFAVTAICLSIIIAGAIITYQPGIIKQPSNSLPSGFRYPSGQGVSQGIPTLYTGTAINDDTQLKTISLTGAGSASAQADHAKVNLGVQTTNTSAKDAIGENANLMFAVVEALKLLDISEEDIV